jgi:hypothetical protein
MRNFFKCLSTLKTSFSFALLLLLSFSAQAVDYSWSVNGFSAPTPLAACQLYANSRTSPSYPKPLDLKVAYASDVQFNCTFRLLFGYSERATRSGDSCPLKSTYNRTTGECEAPKVDKCDPIAGTDILHEHLAGQTSGAVGSEPPGSICEGECQYAYSFEAPGPKGCYRKGGQEKEGIFCKFKYKANGISCTANAPPSGSIFDQPPTKPPISPKPERSQEQTCDNWVTQPDGSSKRSCTSKDSYNKPGGLDCTKTNGYLKCEASNDPPAHTETKLSTDTVKKDNPDGSSKTDTTTKKDLTNCHGAKPCSTTSNETKVTDNKNPDGTPGDKTTTCKGDNCTAEKDPEPGIDPDAEEEAKEESSVTGGAACDSPPTCKGDAIQCAILRQGFTQRCADEKFREVTPEKTQALKADLDAAFSGEQYQPIKATAENTFALDGMIDTSSRFSSSCPVLPVIPYKWVDGTSQNFNPNVEGLCSFLTWMGFLMVAFAMRGAAEIIAGGLK